MGRPRKYATRIDTKVRLREDQRDAIDAFVEATPGMTRNLFIEEAVDRMLGTVHRPKMPRPDPAMAITRPTPGQTRTAPRVTHVGEALAAQTEGIENPRVAPPSTRVVPRSRRR